MSMEFNRGGNDNVEQTPVLVVGGGPAGLVAAITLARHGVPSMLIERHRGTSVFPRATGVSTRTMEILRGWGLEDRVRAGAFHALPMVRVAETLASPDHAAVPLGFPTDEEALAVSPTTPAIAPQDHLEPVLVEHLRSFGTDVRFATELESFEQDATGVTSILVDRASGMRTTVRSRYLVGADGAHSSVRARLGIPMHGADHLEEYVSTLFTAPLSRVAGDPMYGLNMISGPAGPAVFLPTSAQDRWVFARPWDPSSERVEDYTEARITELIRAAAGVPELAPRIIRVMAFSFAAQIAERYREGNAFLVGDAAHRITPRGGTGMNTAIHDAFNLAWKLAFVVRGCAAPALLDTYEIERRPVGERNTARSAGGSDQATADGLAEDLGVTYEEGALIADESAVNSFDGRWQPSARPGARAPHLWLERDGHRFSTLDLFDTGLTVLAGSEGSAWRQAAMRIRVEARLPLRFHQIGQEGELFDTSGRFETLYGIGSGGAILVRPDGYVAWRARSAGAHDTRAELYRGVVAALGLASIRPQVTEKVA
jgi:putative polyketide hydroxylase